MNRIPRRTFTAEWIGDLRLSFANNTPLSCFHNHGSTITAVENRRHARHSDKF